MANDKPGYVYILTNPSFREDWVKIGKSSRPVDVRSKELDNTAVPLPFEIYATMKTVKYNEAESLVHGLMDQLTDKRIRKNREFFNLRPEEALKLFNKVAAVIDDALIEVFDEKAKGSENINSQPSDKPRDKGHIFNREYWDAFVEYMKQNPSDLFHTPSKGTFDHWMNIAIGKSGICIALLLNKREQKATIQLWMSNDAEKKQFDALLALKDQAEASIGQQLDWRRIDGKKASSIELNLNDCGITDKSKWNGIFAWYREYTEKYVTFFKPIIKNL